MIGEPGDKFEQEADRVASQVVQTVNAPASKENNIRQSIQREKDLEGLMYAKGFQAAIQRKKGMAEGEVSNDLESAINSARGGGQPLDPGLQQSMGQAMGADFSGVRVHTNAQSDQLNQSIQARAFTTGQDVFFRDGAYQPRSRGGQELIAHELTHVVQQNSSTNQRLESQENSRERKNTSNLPSNLQAGIESLSGISTDDVTVHYNSSKPSKVQALAYTEGTEIYLAPGQEEHLPHEAWHVVQQKQGRVQSTFQMKGVDTNVDFLLESEADEMGRIASRSTIQSRLPSAEQVEQSAQWLGKSPPQQTSAEGSPVRQFKWGSTGTPEDALTYNRAEQMEAENILERDEITDVRVAVDAKKKGGFKYVDKRVQKYRITDSSYTWYHGTTIERAENIVNKRNGLDPNYGGSQDTDTTAENSKNHVYLFPTKVNASGYARVKYGAKKATVLAINLPAGTIITVDPEIPHGDAVRTGTAIPAGSIRIDGL
ncbi:hypothetical protein AM10699_65150 (plasmid) [Acaryochloris marina MBIC10699]|nr:hypothetical protein AM10699_65150 [Acaryochloris marina MBIC10699]